MHFHKALYIFLILILFGCTTPIDIFDFSDAEKKVVIDGYITDALKSHEIKISYSSTFNSDGIYIQEYEEAAVVVLLDELGNQIVFEHDEKGLYKSSLFQAQFDVNYELKVTIDESVYSSTFKSLPLESTPLDLSYTSSVREELSSTGSSLRPVNGVSVTANVPSSSSDTYLLWEQKQFYIYEAVDFPYPGHDDQAAFFADFAASVYHGRIYEWWYRYCYLQELDLLSINLEILEKKNNDGGLTISNEINFIPCSAKLEHDYAIRVKQLNLDVEAYVYWESIRDATQSSGGIFDAAPFSIRGNMTDQNGAFALGYFGVYREANEDVFFNNSELALCDLQYPEACGGDHSLDVDPCLDCEKAEGESNSKDKPFWWR